MSYAINSTNTGWRAINTETDLLPGETYSDSQPVLSPTLAQVQAAQITALNTAYQAAITAPVSYTTAAGHTDTFAQDAQSKTNLQQALAGSQKKQAWPLNLWLNAAGQPVTPFAYADLQGLADAMEAADVPDYQNLLAKIAAVQAITF